MARRNARRNATVRSFVTSAAATGRLIAGGRLAQPGTHLAWRLVFADGTTSFVFRETALHGIPPADPAVLVVQFRLRMVGTSPLWHALFRRECVLHTPLFAGFQGFRSKLWLTDLRTGVYRGLYQWDGADLAVDYAATLTRLLRAVSVAGSVDHHVLPGIRRDDLLRDPARVSGGREWWRLVASSASASRSG
jgi:hypothetical protein